MRGIFLLLLSAVVLAQSAEPKTRQTCNCDPSDAWQICDANYDKDNVLVAHEYCDRYYLCANGRPVAMDCNDGLLYNPYIEKCDWPENVECGERPISDGQNNDNDDCDDDATNDVGNDKDEDDNVGGEEGGNNEGDGDNGTCNCDPGEAPSICAADDSDDILVAHENCNMFYKCDHGYPVAFTCPKNLFYNPLTEQCDWPANVECGDRIIPEPDDDNNSDTGNDDNDSGNGDNNCDDNCDSNNNESNENSDENGDEESGDNDNGSVGGGNCDPNEAPSICAAYDSEGILVAHENCNMYYICEAGKPVAMPCGNGLLFNPSTDQCDWPENVECGDRVIPNPEDNDNGDSDTGGGDNGGNDNGGGDNDGSDIGDGDNGGNGICNCNPGEAPEICAADGSDGVLIAHENCNQFYKCSNGINVVLTCPSNLLYNPYTEKCDWPENVECGDRVIPDPEDNDNGDSDTGGGDNGGNDNGGGDNDGSDNGDGDNGGNGTCNCNPGEAPEICAADGSDGVLIAHENCNQFYKCSNGINVVLTCPSNLLYNPYTEKCDWPENVECGDRVIPDPEDNDNGDSDTGGGDNGGNDNGGGDNDGSDNGDGDNGGNGTCNCNPGEAPEICAADGSDGVLIAHENCNQFYICSNGINVVLTCPSNLLYNPYTEKCDWPENVECGDRVIPDPEDNDNGDSDTGGGDNGGNDNGGGDNDGGGNGDGDNGGNGICNCNPGEAPEICAADGSDGVLIAHENCNQFYICSNGINVVLTCPSNLLYNPYTEKCDWPENVECGDRVIPDPEDNDNGDSDTGGGDNGGNDNGGGDNDGGGNGDGDNGGNGICNCNPGEAPEICAADGSDGVLIAHENCNQFYICSNGINVVLTCPSNLLYNPYTEKCDWPENVECGDRVIPDPEDNDNGDSDTGGGDNGGNDNGGGDNDGGGNGDGDNGGNGICNCNPGEAPEICAADGSDGVLIAHENCNQFYKCSHGINVVLTCPSNLLYNPYTEKCDWPENVECGDRVIPDPEDNDNGDSDTGGGDNGGNDNGGGDDDGGGNGDGDNGGNGICNCNPGEAPEICAADGSDGVLIAHENCNQFYICSNGINVILTCPSNLLYNPYTEKCDWPENVECGDRVIPDPEDNDNGDSDTGGGDNGGNDNGGGDNDGGGNGDGDNGGNGICNCNPGEAPEICAADGSDGVLIAHENCNQFYICSNGINVVLTCPSNLLYNPYTEKCDWPENVECGDRVIPDPEDNDNGDSDTGGGDNGGNDNGGGDNDGGGNGDGDNGGNGICNCNPGEAPEICAADGSDGVLIAHENCNQFYKCSHGINVVLTCPSNLLYNPYTEKCDWPENVECGDRVIPDPEDNDNGDSDTGGGDNGGNDNGGGDNDGGGNGDGDNGGNGICNCNPGEAPEICAADGSDGVLIAHENCNQFYKCSNGINVVLTCPSNLLYNPYTEKCDWPENVECGDRVIPDPEDNDNGDSDTGGGDNGGNDNGGGDNDGSDNGDGDNGGNGTCNCNPGEAPEICAADGSDGVLIAHENCNQFYICSNGINVVLTCPTNLLYNPYTEKCDWPENVECGDRIIPDPECDESGSGDNGDSDNGSSDDSDGNGTCNCDPGNAPEICTTDGSDGVFIAHENCNKFYTCSNGRPVVQTCASVLLYNPYTEKCDFPQNVNCGDRVIPEAEDNDNSANDNNSADNDSGNNDNDNGGSVDDSNSNDNSNDDHSQAPSICGGSGSDGVFIAHENCDQYYMCSSGIPVEFTCPGDLLFNTDILDCDWPRGVDCGDRVKPDVEGCNCNPRRAPALCAGDNSEGVHIAHEHCNQYYVCTGNMPVAQSCPGVLLYNPYKQVCDWPMNVDCARSITSFRSLNKHMEYRHINL